MTNNFYTVEYRLYTIKDGQQTLVEEINAAEPFEFISGFGVTLPAFEMNIETLGNGDSFNFSIPCAEAYGEYVDERVIDLDKQIFCINGKLDTSRIYPDAVVPLQNEDGNRFMGRVLSITDDKVRIDLNHPLAGCDLQFEGNVIDSHEATNEEIQSFVNRLSGGGCRGCSGGGCHGGREHDCDGGGCGSCGGGCKA
jgi:FKBP-type peptidyl-prolyl cis-trans isomerase SlyD